MGLKWTAYRVGYELRKKTGLLKRKFQYKKVIDDIVEDPQLIKSALSHLIFNDSFTFDYNENEKQIIEEANDICIGKFKYFSDKFYKLSESDSVADINWHRNPVNGYEYPRKDHWLQIEELAAQAGDVKLVWEPSRFGWVFTLVRAYKITNDIKYAEFFWLIFEGWIENNPPELGINWKCGQEISMRVISLVFGLYYLYQSETSSDSRLLKAVNFIYYSGLHVERHFEFALHSVKNNHTISEAVGMFTVGAVFPFFKSAQRLREKGKKYVEKVVPEQIYTDGSYLQHSMTYERLVIDTLSWYLKLAKAYKTTVSKKLETRLDVAIYFLFQMLDAKSGNLPNYGNNDGCLLFPLTNCSYTDFRPSLESLYYQLHSKSLFGYGVWSEQAYWFERDYNNTLIDHIKKESCRFPIGGYYTLNKNDIFVMVRCGKYKDRPGHADMLHADIWIDGSNVFMDAGTYSYNTEAALIDYFVGTRSHNTLMVNYKNQMEKGGRFIWLNWVEGKELDFRVDDGLTQLKGRINNYQGVNHERTIYIDNDGCTIRDEVTINDNMMKELEFSWLTKFHIEKKGNSDFVLSNNGNCYLFSIQSESQIDIEIEKAWYSSFYNHKDKANAIKTRSTTDKDFKIRFNLKRM